MSNREMVRCEVVKVMPGEEAVVVTLRPENYPDEDSMKLTAIKYAQQAAEEDYPWAYAARMVTVYDLWRTP